MNRGEQGMRETNRLKLYSLCEKYLRTIIVRQELIFLDPHLECEDCQDKLNNYLSRIEDEMLNTLKEE